MQVRAGGGQYFQAANGGGSTLNAAAISAGAYETFKLVKQSGGTINNGDVVGLQAASGSWVSAENGGGGAVYAYGAAFGAWESFVFSSGSAPPSSSYTPPGGPGTTTLANGRGATMSFVEYEAESIRAATERPWARPAASDKWLRRLLVAAPYASRTGIRAIRQRHGQ